MKQDLVKSRDLPFLPDGWQPSNCMLSRGCPENYCNGTRGAYFSIVAVEKHRPLSLPTFSDHAYEVPYPLIELGVLDREVDEPMLTTPD